MLMVRAGRECHLLFGSIRILRIASLVNGCYVTSVAEQKSSRFEMVTPAGWLERIDEWRRLQTDLPSRAEAIRRLVKEALDVGTCDSSSSRS